MEDIPYEIRKMWEPQTCYKCVLRERQDKDHYVCLAGNGLIHTSKIRQECNCDQYSPKGY